MPDGTKKHRWRENTFVIDSDSIKRELEVGALTFLAPLTGLFSAVKSSASAGSATYGREKTRTRKLYSGPRRAGKPGRKRA